MSHEDYIELTDLKKESIATDTKIIPYSPPSYLRITGEIYKFSTPLLIAYFIETGSALFFSAKLFSKIGSDELTASGLISAYNQATIVLLQYVLNGIQSVGATITKRSHPVHRRSQLLLQGWIMAAGISLITIPLNVWSSPILRLLQQRKSISDIAQTFLRAVIPGVPAFFVVRVHQQIMVSANHTRAVLAFNILQEICFIIAAPLLAFNADLGIAGVGYARIISNSLNMSLTFIYLLSKKLIRCSDICRIRSNRLTNGLKNLVRIGFPVMLFHMAEVAKILSMGLFIGTMGDDELEAHEIAFQYGLLALLPISAFGAGCATWFTQQCAQAVPTITRRRIVKASLLVSLSFPTLAAVIYIGAREALANFFLTSDDENIDHTRALTKTLLIYAAANLPADTIRHTANSLFTGLQRTKILTIINFIVAPLNILTMYLLKQYTDMDSEGAWLSNVLFTAAGALTVGIALFKTPLTILEKKNSGAVTALPPEDEKIHAINAAVQPIQKPSCWSRLFCWRRQRNTRNSSAISQELK